MSLKLRLRLPNGGRCELALEPSHTLGQLVDTLVQQQGYLDAQLLQLLAGFPPKPLPLDQPHTSLAQAGLANNDTLTVRYAGASVSTPCPITIFHVRSPSPVVILTSALIFFFSFIQNAPGGPAAKVESGAMTTQVLVYISSSAHLWPVPALLTVLDFSHDFVFATNEECSQVIGQHGA